MLKVAANGLPPIGAGSVDAMTRSRQDRVENSDINFGPDPNFRPDRTIKARVMTTRLCTIEKGTVKCLRYRVWPDSTTVCEWREAAQQTSCSKSARLAVMTAGCYPPKSKSNFRP